VLNDTCPESGYRLCAYKGHLPDDGNDYLWAATRRSTAWADSRARPTSPGRSSSKAETLPAPSSENGDYEYVEQFSSFETGDSIEPLNDVPVPALTRHMPHLMEGYRASRQQKDAIDFRWVNAVQVPVGALSIVALAAIPDAAAWRRSWNDRLFLPAFVLVALAGNAFVCGVLSSPHDRYQSRLIWMATFSVLCLLHRSGLKFRLTKFAEAIGIWLRPRHTAKPA